MAESNQYLIFKILLTDPVQVATLQGNPTPGSAVGAILAAPDAAAITYAAPLSLAPAPVVPKCIISEWFGKGFPTDVATFDRKSGGWFGWSWLFGDTTHYHWRGEFQYVPPPEVPGPSAPPPLCLRHWIDGFEFPNLGEGGSGSSVAHARGSSRHVQGYGFPLRSNTNTVTHAVPENTGGGVSTAVKTWERFYLRPRRNPSTSATFWRTTGFPSVGDGYVLQHTASGQVALFISNALGTLTLVGTTPALPLNVWVLVDCLINLTGPTFRLFFNHVEQLTYAGLAPTGKHQGSTLGCPDVNDLCLDIDDWINCVYPTDAQLSQGADFNNGSAVLVTGARGFDASHNAAWVGDWRSTLLNPAPGATAGLVSSTPGARACVTTDAALTLDQQPGAIGLAALNVGAHAAFGVGAKVGYTLGAAAEVLSAGTAGGGASEFNLLYRGPGTAVAVQPVTPLTLSYVHGTAATPETLTTLLATAELIGTFGPEDLPVGANPSAAGPSRFDVHNAPYPRSPWATLTKPPIQPLVVVSGTYVGTGTAQDLAFAVPIHFLWIRPIGVGDTGGVKWFSSCLAAHTAALQGTCANLMAQALLDPDYVPIGGATDPGNTLPPTPATLAEAVTLSNQLAYGHAKNAVGDAAWAPYLTDPDYYFKRMLGWQLLADSPDLAPFGLYAIPPSPWNTQAAQVLLRLTGADAQNNALGVTYAYLAVGDPGMRFLINGCLTDFKGAVDRVTTLAHPTFTPLAGFLWAEVVTIAGASTLYYKGPGHAPSSCSLLTAAESPNAISWGAAGVTAKAAFNALYAQQNQVAFSLWRMDDGSGHAGAVVQILSYVGNGAASRSIALTPASGKRPLFALVVPHNAATVQRDAQHPGTTSTQVPATPNAASGITGGDIDTLIVGSILNTNAVVYDVFVIPGSDVAGNGGFSIAGTFYPVPAEPPPGAPSPADFEFPDPDDPGEPTDLPDPLPPAGPLPGLTDDLDPACEPDTRRICNVALGRIGISKQILNVATTQTAEAVAVRLLYTDAVQETLRDFPWPFATRYVQLAVLNGGARPNSDWLYAYRQPSDCLFERRLVVSRTDVANPDTIPFQLSSDDTGGLIFCNLANAVLEYTARPKCPHTRSEPLFRDAVAWKLALALAPSLSRMTDAAVLCAKAYQAAIDQAYVVLRPGNAGETPAAATIDLSAAAQAANLAVANAALVQIGAATIRNLTSDQSRAAQLVRICFEQELRATLRDYPWPFATVYVTPTLVAGTSAVPVNGDWQYSYRVPADLVFARRLVTGRRRAYEPNPATFKLAQDATGGLLYTDVESTTPTPLVLEYTNRPEGAVLVADALFRDALAWRLAWKLAPSLALLVPERPEAVGRGPDESAEKTKERTATGTSLRSRAADKARECYYYAIKAAELGAAREAQIDIDPPDAEWISERD